MSVDPVRGAVHRCGRTAKGLRGCKTFEGRQIPQYKGAGETRNSILKDAACVWSTDKRGMPNPADTTKQDLKT